MISKKKILFVDDEEDILMVLKDIFSEEDMTLFTARSVSEALNIIREYNIDFIFSDLKLPDSSGKELLERVEKESPQTIRALSSGSFELDMGQIRMDKRDGTFYLSKPWDLFVVKQLITERLS